MQMYKVVQQTKEGIKLRNQIEPYIIHQSRFTRF